MTVSVDLRQHHHEHFVDDGDLPQSLYEMARQGALRGCLEPAKLLQSIAAHGAAGVLIDPESIVVSSASAQVSKGCRRGTAFHHSHLSEQAFETIAKSLGEGVGVRATARIQNVDKRTVLLVLRRAARQAVMVVRTLLRDLVVSECQLDEMWSFVGKKERNLDRGEKLQGFLGDAWIWTAFDAVNKIVLAFVVGKRTLPYAIQLLEEVKRVTARTPGIFSSDQLDQYTRALLQVYGNLVTRPRKPGPGRPPKPRLAPPEDLLYVQVVKHHQKGRVIKVERRVVFGDAKEAERILGASVVSQRINTSHAERNNATVRHIDARCARKTYRFSKTARNHVRQLSLSLGYYHLCRPHRTLTARHGQPTTPFMAAGLTDRVWTMRELLAFAPQTEVCA